MSKQPNPALIGSFVVGAIVLRVAATLLFGGTELFGAKNRFVTYFEGSVKGLRVGANVTFRGVRVGYVTDIRLQAQADSLQTLIPVTIEVVPGAFQILEGDRVLQGEELVDRLRLEQLVDAGLRAQLNVESYVTGQLVIEMDFLPDQPAVMRGINPNYPEIPTVPNDFEQAIGNIQKLISGFKEKVDIDAAIKDIQGVLQGLNKLVNSPDLHDSIAGLNTLINADETQRLAASLAVTAKEFDATFLAIRAFIDKSDRQWSPLAEQLDATLEALQDSLQTMSADVSGARRQFEQSLLQAEQTMRTVDGKLRDDSPFSHRLDQALDEFERAARSLRIFLDYVEQHPEALIRGKQLQ
ncbi:MAG: MlaD family protein [Gammaproteobacteria bacterium]